MSYTLAFFLKVLPIWPLTASAFIQNILLLQFLIPSATYSTRRPLIASCPKTQIFSLLMVEENISLNTTNLLRKTFWVTLELFAYLYCILDENQDIFCLCDCHKFFCLQRTSNGICRNRYMLYKPPLIRSDHQLFLYKEQR